MKIGASFSACRQYRYTLHRIWQPRRPLLCWVLLNPSTADETRDDPTIRRCITRAINAGFGGVEIVNLFAWRSTYPSGLTQTDDPIGPENDAAIFAAVQRAARVVCGWGKFGVYRSRDQHVLRRTLAPYCEPYALGLNEDGTPVHPLYIAYRVDPQPLAALLAQRKN